MQLTIPEGAHIQIIVGGHAPMLALPNDPPAGVVSYTRRRPLLTAALAGALLFGAYQFGRHTGPGASATKVAQAEPQAAVPSSLVAEPSAETGSQPPRAAAARPAASPAQIPPAFTQQLQQAPTVVPPPGQPSSPGGSNPFGLHQ